MIPTEDQKHRWSCALREALEHVQDSLKKLETDEMEAVDEAVMGAQQALRTVSDGISREEQMGDPVFLQNFAQMWFREAEVLCQLVNALPDEPVMSEGDYQWRIQEIHTPPLQMPEEFEDFKDGPILELAVGSNSEYVCFEIRVSESGKLT